MMLGESTQKTTIVACPISIDAVRIESTDRQGPPSHIPDRKLPDGLLVRTFHNYLIRPTFFLDRYTVENKAVKIKPSDQK